MPTRHHPSTPIVAVFILAASAILAAPGRCAGHASKLTLEQLREVVATHFRTIPGYRPGDIISQSDVKAALRQLATYGFQPEDGQQILDDTLSDSNSLVTLLRTERGRKYMAKVNGYTLIYDRLDRVTRVSGGRTTLEMLIRLPNGEKFSHLKSQLPNGVPDILDLMPKKGNGLVRSIKGYEKPTGRVYSEADLIRRLERSFESEPIAAQQ